jgi:transcriptional regulator with XRE-family HTH domain
MPRTVSPLLPSTNDLLRQLGERLRLARLRRRLSAKHVAARAGMAPMTLRSVERGGSGVTMGAYLAVMQVLGVEKDLDLLAKADPTGRALQDARLSTKTSGLPEVPARRTQEPILQPLRKQRDARAPIGQTQPNTMKRSPDRIQNNRFTSARTLAALLDAPPHHRGRAKRR